MANLRVERSLGVEFQLVTKETKRLVGHRGMPALAHGIGDELHDSGRDGYGRSTEREEHVASRDHGASDETNHPCADCVDGKLGVVGWLDGHAHFGIGRVFHDERRLNGGLFLQITGLQYAT